MTSGPAPIFATQSVERGRASSHPGRNRELWHRRHRRRNARADRERTAWSCRQAAVKATRV